MCPDLYSNWLMFLWSTHLQEKWLIADAELVESYYCFSFCIQTSLDWLEIKLLLGSNLEARDVENFSCFFEVIILVLFARRIRLVPLFLMEITDFSDPVQSSLIKLSCLVVGVVFYLSFVCLASRYFLISGEENQHPSNI